MDLFFFFCELSVTCPFRELIDKAEKNMDAEVLESIFSVC